MMIFSFFLMIITVITKWHLKNCFLLRCMISHQIREQMSIRVKKVKRKEPPTDLIDEGCYANALQALMPILP